MTRVGAPVWLAFLMLSWGIVSACTAAVRTRAQFFCIRVLLGITEAGCFPGARAQPDVQCMRACTSTIPQKCGCARLREFVFAEHYFPTTQHNGNMPEAPIEPAGAWYHLSLFLDDMQLNFAFACVLAGAATAQV